MAQEIVSRRTYLGVYAALLAFTILTVSAAFIDLGPLSTFIALGIAVCKGLLVLLFFMHVRYSSHLIWIAVAAGVFWLGILLVLTMSDYLTRDWLPVGGW
jgi:cytochrome c oxidase subunit IV